MNSPPNEPNLLSGKIDTEGKSKWVLNEVTECSQRLRYAADFPSRPRETSKAARHLADGSKSSSDRSLAWKVITSWFPGVTDMYGEWNGIPNIHHPVVSINQATLMPAMSNSDGHYGDYWPDRHLSYTEGRMSLRETYPGFSKRDFMEPNESMSKEDRKRCLSFPKDVGLTSVKGWEIHSPAVPPKALWKVAEGWPLVSPLPQPSHIQTGVESTRKKKQERKRSSRRTDCGTVHSGKCLSKQNISGTQKE